MTREWAPLGPAERHVGAARVLGYYAPSPPARWALYGRAMSWAVIPLVLGAVAVGSELAADPAAGLATLAHVGIGLGVCAAVFAPTVRLLNRRDRRR